MVVNVPHDFVAGGQTLAKGTYTVGRVSILGSRALVLSRYENRSSVTLLPTSFENVPAEQPQLSFEQVGDEYVLTKIDTPLGTFNIPTSRSLTVVARAMQYQGRTSSGSN